MAITATSTKIMTYSTVDKPRVLRRKERREAGTILVVRFVMLVPHEKGVLVEVF
jgi:hypothetical protein